MSLYCKGLKCDRRNYCYRADGWDKYYYDDYTNYNFIYYLIILFLFFLYNYPPNTLDTFENKPSAIALIPEAPS